MKKMNHPLRTRLTALLLTLVCVLGLLPSPALAAGPSTIKLERFGYYGVSYQSASLGRCLVHQMYYDFDSKTTIGFCGTKGAAMNNNFRGHTWNNPRDITDPTVKMMMGYYYSHSLGIFTDVAIAAGVNDVWDAGYTWYMNAWVQAIIWRYKAGTMSDPVVACAEELMYVYNSLEGTSFSSVDQAKEGHNSFRDRAQYIFDLGAQGAWGDCSAYEYTYAGSASGSVQKIIIGKLNITSEKYTLIVKKVDSTNPSKGLPGAEFHIETANGSYSKDIVTGSDGTYTLTNLEAGTYAVTEVKAPDGYKIDNAGPQYVVLPSNGDKTVVVTFSDTPEITGEGSIRKVDADDPTKGLAGAVIKITGVDNSFTGTYITGEGGYLNSVPWDSMPIGSYTAEEVTPPEGYTKSPDASKVKQTFHWDGKSDVSLVFENDSKVKIRLLKLDDSNNPLPGAVFNIFRDGQLIGTEATKEDGSITVTDIAEGMYAFVEVSAPAPYDRLTEPVIAHVDQATINGGGTVTVSAADKKLPNLTILKRDAQTGDVIPDTHFEICGIHFGYHNDVTTGPDGTATLTGIPTDSYEVTEISVPAPYVVSDKPTQTIWLEAGDDKELIFDNLKQPLLRVTKVEKGTGTKIPNTVFLLEGIDSDYRQNVTTGTDGWVELRVAPGSYRITEQSVPEPYVIGEERTKTISLNPGDEKEVTFENLKKPALTLSKVDADTQKPIPNTVLRVEAVNGDYQDDWTTGADGKVTKRVEPGTYRVTEISVPAPYYLPDKDADRVQTISLNPGDEKVLVFRNRKAPEVTVFKENSITGEPIEHAKFRAVYTSNGEAAEAPATIDFGELFTDAKGEIRLHEQGKRLYPGEYTFTELEPADGFQLKEPLTQTVIVHGNESKTVRFQNTPLSALVVWKYDSVTGEPVEGAVFQVKYMSGTSGTGGTVIGTYKTGPGGSFTINRLKAGAYTVEELASDGNHVMDTAPQTAYISGDEQAIVQLYFGNSPKGSLLIKKIDAATHEPLSDVEFLITDSHGTMLGDANGKYVTDSAGTILISNIDPGTTLVVRETRAKENYILDDVPQTATIKAGQTVSLEFRNQPKGSVTLYKFSSLDRRTPLEGVGFKITFADGQVVDNIGGKLSSNGIYYTDSEGQINISGVTGTLVFTEISTIPGYLIDENRKSQTIVVNPNDHQSVYFYNQPIGSIVVKKMSSTTKEPLSDVVIRITRTDGTVVGESNGEFRTDENGFIKVDVEPGSYIIQEVKAKSGFLLDDTPKTIDVKGSGTYNIELFNQPLGSLVIHKYSSLDRKTPLAGVQFKVAYAPGCVVDDENGKVSSNGIYYTESDGTITINGIVGTVTITEQATIPGYTIDPATQSQTIVVNPDDVQHAYFYNTPKNTLIIEKYIEEEGSEHKPLKGVTFMVTDSSGAVIGNSNGEYVSGDDGRVVIPGVEPGSTISVREIKVPDGVVLDGIPKTIKISEDGANILRFYNKKTGYLVIQKKDKNTLEPLSGVEFELTYAEGGYVDDAYGHLSSKGRFTTNEMGEIRVPVVGTVVVKEVKCLPGYVMDPETQVQTVTVNPADTQTLVFYNEGPCSLTLSKKDAVTGKPVPNTEFTLKDGNGNILGRYSTGSDGTVTVTGLLAGSTVVAFESKVPSGYVLDSTPQTIVLKSGSNSYSSGTVGNTNLSSGGNGNSLDFENQPTVTLTIEKYLKTEAGEVPLKGVTFLITDSAGKVIGSSNGEFITGADGRIVISNLEPGITVTAREISVPDGVVLDSMPKSILIEKGMQSQTLRFVNQKTGYLVVRKLDKISKQPLSGVEFELTYAEGGYVDDVYGHLSSKGRYTTNDMGEIRVPVVGTVVVKEVTPCPGYIIDEATKIQTVTVNPADTQTVTMYNEPLCSLTLTKLDAVTGKPVPNTEFTLKDGDGNILGRYTTGSDGTVTVTGLIPNSTVVVVETRVPSNYVLDPTPRTIIVRNGNGNRVTTGTGNTVSGGTSSGFGSGNGNSMTVENLPKTTLTIEKYLKTETGEVPLKGVTFLVTDSSGAVVGTSNGEFTSDENGRIVIPNLEPGITITAKEISVPDGVVLDGTPKSIEIKGGEGGQTLRFVNQAMGYLVIKKLDKLTGKPLTGVEFKLSYASGQYVDDANGHLSSLGLYKTDANGEIRVPVVGTVVVEETKTLPNYTIDPGTQRQVVTVNPADTQTITVYNTPDTNLTIQKYIENADAPGTGTEPLAGVTFLITDSAGTPLGPNNGEYVTDEHGQIRLNAAPGTTITAKEIKVPSSEFVLDGAPKSILIKEGEAQQLTFYNKRVGGLELIKVSESDETKRIPNTTFEIRKMDGALVETVTTGENGRVHVPLDAGAYYAVEIKAAEGFKIDATPHYFTIRDNETTTLSVTNAAFSGIIIHKINSLTGDGIYDVKFLLYDENKNPIGQYSTDNEGYIYIDDLTVQGKGRLYLRELEAAPGYELDKEYKTIYVQPGKTIEIEWENTPITGQIQVMKYAAEYNEVTGTPAGTPLQGAVYEISDPRSNKVVDYITTDARGIAASKPLPLGRYKIVEVTAPAYWQLSKTVFDETLEYSGQIIKVSDYDKPAGLGVVITKRGNAEVLAGNQMRYDFTVANSSNVALENFYWHDRIPTDVARAMVISTGTYSARLNYRILYKTNYSSTYQVLASNLITTSPYSFSLSAIPMQAGEYVTDVYFDFGKVPVGFQSTSNPTLTVAVNGTAANGYQLVNRADAGGKYQGTWQTAQATWVTVVRKLTPTVTPKLPKTGY